MTERRCVLVVDDDADVRSSFLFLLQSEGYTTLEAANGREALEVLHRHGRPCLILLDLLMPIMDGIEFLTAMRSDEELARVPVVIISAASTAKPPKDVPLLQKPVSLEVLIDHVERHCVPGAPSA